MSEIDDVFEELASPTANHVRRPQRPYPEGFEPGVTWDGTEGVLNTRPKPADEKPLLEDELRFWGMNPDEVEVIEPFNFRTWLAPIGGGQTQRMTYYKVNLRRRRGEPGVDLDELVKWVRSHKPKKGDRKPGGAGALVVAPADWQAGKRGTKAMADRWLDTIGRVEDRWKQLSQNGYGLDRLVVPFLGDLVEGCDGHYAQQRFTVELDERGQRKLVRWMITRALKDWARMAPQVIVAPVAGNHGEVRAGGKSVTTFADNVDVAVVEDVAHAFSLNEEAFGHVSFMIPHDDLTQTLDVHGTVLGLAHGHQFPKRAMPQAAETWWKGQQHGRQPIGDADILLSGHRHHLIVTRNGSRTVMQAPQLDDGSEWFKNIAGVDSPPGTLTFAVSKAAGWDDLKVL